MGVIQLRHDPALKYASHRDLLPLSSDVLRENAQKVIVTFRPLESGQPNELRERVNACMRLNDLPARDLVFAGVETDSPLAPLLLWDAAHHLPVGCSISICSENVERIYLERDYFRGSLVVESKSGASTVFRKVSALPAEREKGLDNWTFGIPAGPEDATFLNAAVKRILELDVKGREILLCGRPGANFAYWEHVRIVGEDIPSPPVRIAAKKNRLAEEARYENLCILHDRVFLPKNFAEAVRRFGDCFSPYSFQSLYFDDRFNLVPRRYSDLNHTAKRSAHLFLAHRRASDSELSSFAPPVLPEAETQEFVFSNPLRHNPNSYLTGSLYIAKKQCWLACPLDDTLYWTEFEDVEWGYRLSDCGIPSRCNPFALTQSMIGRPLLSTGGAVTTECADGRRYRYCPPTEQVARARKPLVKVLQENAERDYYKFVKAYLPQGSAQLSTGMCKSTRSRLQAALQAAHLARVPVRFNALQSFVRDYERLVVQDQAPYQARQELVQELFSQGNSARMKLPRLLINHCAQRPSKDTFGVSNASYFPRRGLRTYVGSAISAMILTLKNGKAFFLPGGYRHYLRAILASTPWSSYVEKAK